MRKLFSLSAALLLLAAGAPARADSSGGFWDEFRQARSKGKSTVLVDIDNDSLLMKRDDGFYTSGMRFTMQYTLPGPSAQGSTTYGWRIGQDQYTASDINLPPERVGPPDHPYAAWLYAGLFKQTDRADGTHLRLGADIGCIGPCAGGEWAQKTLHRIIQQPLPQAWSTQVRNEFGVVVYADMAPVRWTVRPWLDVTPNLHARFGNIFTDAGAGVTLRAGQLAALPGMPTSHAFLRVDASAVGYNASLQGGYFSSGNMYTVKPKRGVGEAEIGWIWSRDPYGLQISVIRRSNEIQDLPNSKGMENFARLQFVYSL